MLFTKNYQNYSMLVETTACLIWRFFEAQCSLRFPKIGNGNGNEH